MSLYVIVDAKSNEQLVETLKDALEGLDSTLAECDNALESRKKDLRELRNGKSHCQIPLYKCKCSDVLVFSSVQCMYFLVLINRQYDVWTLFSKFQVNTEIKIEYQTVSKFFSLGVQFL